VLSLLQTPSGRHARCAHLPSGVLPSDARGGIDRARQTPARSRVPWHDPGRAVHARARLLPRQLRKLAGADDRRRASRPRRRREIRRIDRSAFTHRASKEMTIDVYIPRDAAALSVGAESVARAIAAEAESRGTPIRLVRNGSRGLQWLEPLVEVATPNGRLAYGPVSTRDVVSLFDAQFLQGGAHPLCRGL